MSAVAHRRTIAVETASAAALTCLTFLLYRKVLTLWWIYDDTDILRTLFENRFIDIFTSAHVWPQQLFTPLLMVGFDTEWNLFAFDPARWYAVQLAIACATTILVYAAARQFLDTKRSFVAAALFGAGPPLCSVVSQLSTMHYFMAVSFGALAVIAFVAALRRSGIGASGKLPRWFLALSVACYFLAMLAKEVAIPLPLLLVALPLRDARTRMRFVLGHGLAAVVYFLWRYSVLGTFFGAYGWQIDAAEWPRLLLLLPWRIAQGAAGAGLATGGALVAVMMLTIVFGVRDRRALVLVLLALIVVVGPMLPLAKEIARRYVVVPWLALSIAFAAATTRRSGAVAAALLIAVPLLALAANRQEWRHEFPLRRRMSDEGRFFFYDMPPDAMLRRPLTPPAMMVGLWWVKTIHFGRPAGGWFYDDIFLCGNGTKGKRVFEYQATGVVDITRRVSSLAASHCHSIRYDVPLSVTLHFRKPAIYWDLGPYGDGQYSAVLGDGVQAFQIPPRDALKIPGTNSLALRIRYDSPAGWKTYSPELTLDVAGKTDVSWHR
jgi:hypothetical protein